jgi:hypothetical protein
VVVGLPPPPTLAAALAARTVQVTETRTVDVASGFAGRIDSYTAVSGDAAILAVTVDGSRVALTGVEVGSTTVTITAINAAGRAARSFNVTVTALEAPRTAAAPLARTIAVGGELDIDVADAFTGIIHGYTATSDNTPVATTSVDGSTVTLVGVAEGTATVTLAAANAAGQASVDLPVTVQAADELTLAVAAPSHCLGSEGTLAPGGGRRGVGSMDVTHHVSGGAGPYTITSPDAPDVTRTGPTGTLTVSCARRGVGLGSVGPEVNVVEAGPRTIRIDVTDNTGATTHADILVEVAEDAYTTEYNGGLMHPGRTYVLGTPDEWVLLTLPEGLTLRFTGLSEHNMAHFTEPTSGAEIILDWTTGAEIRRTIPTTAGRERRSAGSTQRFAPQAATAPTILTALSATGVLLSALAVAKPTGPTYGATSTEWRPYDGLPDRVMRNGAWIYPEVAVHPRMLIGESIRVCTSVANTDMAASHIRDSVTAWNHKIRTENPAFPRNVFVFYRVCPQNARDIDVTVIVVPNAMIKDDEYCRVDVLGCAEIMVTGYNPPTIRGKRIFVRKSHSAMGQTVIHELGHFLGLGDYHDSHARSCMSSDEYKSIMASGKCRTDAIQSRDLEDLHDIYYPGARTLMQFFSLGPDSWQMFSGFPPPDTGGRVRAPKYVSNALNYIVHRRAADSSNVWEPIGWFSRDLIAKFLVAGRIYKQVDKLPNLLVQDLRLRTALDDIVGYEFRVVGITGGDIMSAAKLSLGAPAVVYGPPSKPENLVAVVSDQDVVLSWGSVPGATDYYVHVYYLGGVEPYRSEVVRADPSMCRTQVTVSGLASRVTHVFRVEAVRSGVFMRSEMSEEVTARLSSGRNPRWLVGGVPSSDQRAALPGSCVVPVEVGPVVGVSMSCPADGYLWVERVVGGGVVCDRLDSAPSVAGERVAKCPKVAPEYAVVSVGGVEKCRRVLVAAPAESLGDPECAEGFDPVLGGASCSMTDSVAATATLGCGDGYDLVNLGTPLCYDSVAASASTEDECRSGYRLVGSRCVSSVAATETVRYSCRAPYSLVNLGTPLCYGSVAASASTEDECRSGYRLVSRLVGGSSVRLCERTVAATATVTYSCEAGFTLVNLGVRFCYRSVAASGSTVHECRSGYRLVSRLVGGSSVRLCERTVAASAAYSCDSGYTRSGRFCSKHIYTSPRNGSCPAGYTAFFNGFAHLCRKKVTVAATVTYSCLRGYTLSGRTCTRRVAPTSRTTYSCDAGYTLSGRTCTRRVAPTAATTYSCDAGYTLSGRTCTRRVAPTSRVVHDCDDAPAGYTLSGTNCVHSTAPISTPGYHCNNAPAGHTLSGVYCVHRVAPTSRVVYDCDKAPAGYTLSGAKCTHTTATTTNYHCNNAPAGYTLSGVNCVKTTTKPPTRPTIYTCRADYTRIEPADAADKPTCTKIDIIAATVTTTPRGCDATPPGEPPYQLQQDHIAGTIRHTCERTITVDATITKTHTCPTRYKLNKTIRGGQIEYTCRLNTH